MIFVTGGTGFLGSYLLYHLCLGGEKVKALIRPGSSKRQVETVFRLKKGLELLNTIEWVEGDLYDYPFLLETIEDCTSIYHCAADVSFGRKRAKQFLSESITATENIVNAALHYDNIRFCHVSSIATLGSGNGKIIDENTHWDSMDGASIYSMAKYFTEFQVWRGIEEGLNAFIVNPSVILGINVRSRQIPSILKIATNTGKYPPGSTAYIGVDDTARLMILLNKSPFCSERVILSAENLSYAQLFKSIVEYSGLKVPEKSYKKWQLQLFSHLMGISAFIRGGRNPFSQDLVEIVSKKLVYSNKKIIELTGYSFTPISVELTSILDFYKEQTAGKNR